MTDDDDARDGTDPTQAIETFLDGVETVYEEYDQGYVDADAALRRLRGHVEELRRTRD